MNKEKTDWDDPKPVEQSFPGMTGKVTAAFQEKGKYLKCISKLLNNMIHQL